MDHLSLMMYIEIDVLCIILILYIMHKSYAHVERRLSWQFFQFASLCILLFVSSDLLWILMEYGIIPSTMTTDYAVNCSYFLFNIAAAASWFFYTESELNAQLIKKKRFLLLSSIPLIATVFILCMNGSTQWLFYIDQNGIYHRGSLNILGFLIPCYYLFASVVDSLSRAFRKENYANRRLYVTLAAFTLTTTVPCIINTFLSGTPLPCIGVSVAVLLVYVNEQELLVSIDPLTKLNNRYHMYHYLNAKIERQENDLSLFLMLIDLDDFKQINDTYGHIEGDQALMRMSDALKRTAGAYDCFAARYGGDEFILIYETANESEINDIYNFLETEIEKINKNSNVNYSIKFSMGFAKHSKHAYYIPDLIKASDDMLYQVKKEKKKRKNSRTS